MRNQRGGKRRGVKSKRKVGWWMKGPVREKGEVNWEYQVVQ